jgi:hypothetical protein
MTVTNDQETHRGPVHYVNYNIRFHSGWGSPTVKEVVRWIEENRVDGRLFESFDGGGSNGLILECQELDGILRFCRDWLNGRGSRCWAEDKQGRHHAMSIEGGVVSWRE